MLNNKGCFNPVVFFLNLHSVVVETMYVMVTILLNLLLSILQWSVNLNPFLT